MLTMERVRTRLGEAGREGDSKDEFEPVRASRRILRCPQRGQPPARRDVRWHWPSTGEQGAQATVEWAPSVDVLQKDGDLVVRVEMPGVKPEDVHVAVHNRVLTISGERKVDEEEERAGYYVRELRHGSFQRSMILPEGVDEEKIHARYQDGILEVALEGAAAAREPRSIQIEVPPGGQQSATDVEVGELGTEASTPTTESARPGATLPGEAPPEAPPETPPR